MTDRYIFGGNRTDQPPFVDHNGTPVYQGVTGQRLRAFRMSAPLPMRSVPASWLR